jgi:sensor c-di-GMP phosphodiesterase-like protein
VNSALQPSAGATITYLTPRNEDGEEAALRGHLYDILARRQLSAVFQPIVHMRSGEIIAYEGLVRGPSDSALHSPLNLFATRATARRWTSCARSASTPLG